MPLCCCVLSELSKHHSSADPENNTIVLLNQMIKKNKNKMKYSNLKSKINRILLEEILTQNGLLTEALNRTLTKNLAKIQNMLSFFLLKDQIAPLTCYYLSDIHMTRLHDVKRSSNMDIAHLQQLIKQIYNYATCMERERERETNSHHGEDPLVTTLSIQTNDSSFRIVTNCKDKPTMLLHSKREKETEEVTERSYGETEGEWPIDQDDSIYKRDEDKCVTDGFRMIDKVGGCTSIIKYKKIH
ncbi:hypothetical protein HYC85_030393 [Camellia sinensis]|uniref:Uncharacterized protein n=1 Tax=Camellia sinensis TaxID=4442 RepID=A0A7J7G0R9_CAMSI|nr:hypothetical protein HYC85_030393 [Camellia sinensis]